MTTNVARIASEAQSFEQQLSVKLTDHNATNVDVARLLQDYRGACEKLLYTDLQPANHDNVEDRLWAAHSKVNGYFRKQLNQTHRNSKLSAADTRSLQKQYLEFIKASQRFYRQYILRLDQQYGGIAELRQVAQRWKDENSKHPVHPATTGQDRQQILRSCHQTLIQLGDLSRYRAAEVGGGGGKERNWGPAIGYYTLATEIYPDSGISHHQQAIIARSDGSHFRTLYHLYRSLSTKNRYPLAKQNLELEFKKILSAWTKGELIRTKGSRDADEGAHALVAWFIRLHSRCYKGEEFAGYDELEKEVLGQLVVEVKERSLDGKLHKLVIINIAAEYFATIQLNDDTGNSKSVMKSYFYFLRLNLKTFLTLLRVFSSELGRLSEGEDVKEIKPSNQQQLSDKMSDISRRVLPVIRLYSSWFVRYWVVLNAQVADTITVREVQELWKVYSSVLTFLASYFPANVLPQDDYLLEEDVDTIGFQPLTCAQTEKVWYNNGKLKLKFYDSTIEKNRPKTEMMMRIRDFLIDGLRLTQDDSCPLQLEGLEFIYEDNTKSEDVATDSGDNLRDVVQQKASFLAPQQSLTNMPTNLGISRGATPSESTASFAKDSFMKRMVDDLVDGDRSYHGLLEDDSSLATPPEQTFDDTELINDSSYGIPPLTAHQMTRNFSQISHSADTTLRASNTHPNQSVGASPVLRQLPSLPSLPDQSSIWNRNYSSPGPSSPYASHATIVRNTPLRPVANGHSREHSLSSIRSFGHSHDVWGTIGQSPSQGHKPHQLLDSKGNGVNHNGGLYLQNSISNFANIYGQDRTTSPTNLGHDLMSPLLLGGSPWNSTCSSRDRSTFEYSQGQGTGG